MPYGAVTADAFKPCPWAVLGINRIDNFGVTVPTSTLGDRSIM